MIVAKLYSSNKMAGILTSPKTIEAHTDCDVIVAKLYSSNKMMCALTSPKTIEAHADGIVIGASVPVYKGNYIVTPKTVEQTLSTENKKMVDDVTITPIPCHEVSNKTGITITIGGI